MQNTITIDLELQAMTCCVCKDLVEIPRKLMRDQDGIQQMHEYLAGDHRECAANPTQPELAKRNRDWRKRFERENRKAAERKAA